MPEQCEILGWSVAFQHVSLTSHWGGGGAQQAMFLSGRLNLMERPRAAISCQSAILVPSRRRRDGSLGRQDEAIGRKKKQISDSEGKQFGSHGGPRSQVEACSATGELANRSGKYDWKNAAVVPPSWSVFRLRSEQF